MKRLVANVAVHKRCTPIGEQRPTVSRRISAQIANKGSVFIYLFIYPFIQVFFFLFYIQYIRSAALRDGYVGVLMNIKISSHLTLANSLFSR